MAQRHKPTLNFVIQVAPSGNGGRALYVEKLKHLDAFSLTADIQKARRVSEHIAKSRAEFFTRYYAGIHLQAVEVK